MKEKDLALLEIYHREWQFRHEGLWKRLLQFYVIIFFVSTLPITYTVFPGAQLPPLSYISFPIAGILLILFFLWYCLAESIRINAIDDKVKRIIGDNFPDGYHKTSLLPFREKSRRASKLPLAIFRWPMAIWVPISLSIIQLVIALSVIFMITAGIVR